MNEDTFILTKKISEIVELMYDYTKKFDRSYRYSLGEHCVSTSLELLTIGVAIKRRVYKKTDISKADINIDLLRDLVRIACDRLQISKKELDKIGDMLDECGRIIGRLAINESKK